MISRAISKLVAEKNSSDTISSPLSSRSRYVCVRTGDKFRPFLTVRGDEGLVQRPGQIDELKRDCLRLAADDFG
jgi:hypothetical protein